MVDPTEMLKEKYAHFLGLSMALEISNPSVGMITTKLSIIARKPMSGGYQIRSV